MGRKKLDEAEASERRKMQEVICYLIKDRRPELSHSQCEDLLLIANAAKDGGVFRKIARGKQLVSRLKLEQMIRECEKAKIFTEQDFLDEMQVYFDKRDDEIIKKKLGEFYEQLEIITTFASLTSAELQDEFIGKMNKSIKKVRGTV